MSANINVVNLRLERKKKKEREKKKGGERGREGIFISSQQYKKKGFGWEIKYVLSKQCSESFFKWISTSGSRNKPIC